MLSKYTDNYEVYKSYALKICGDNILKDDLVNDMYIKLHGILEKEPNKLITDSYIYLIIRSIFINGINKNKEILIDEFPDIPNDVDDKLYKRVEVDKVLDEMRFFDREILLKSQEQSFRELGKQINSHHSTVSKYYKNSLNKFKELCQEKKEVKDLETP